MHFDVWIQESPGAGQLVERRYPVKEEQAALAAGRLEAEGAQLAGLDRLIRVEPCSDPCLGRES